MLRRNLIVFVAALSTAMSGAHAMENSEAIRRAHALIDSGIQHERGKRWGEATKDYSEALSLYQSVDVKVPSDASTLASLLHNIGHLYGIQDRRQEARKAYEEALTMYRNMAAKDARYLPEIPELLLRLAKLLRPEKNQEIMALAYAEEAVKIGRVLARKNPAVFQEKLADNLVDLAAFYTDRRRFVESKAILSEAIDIYRSLLRTDPKPLASLAQKMNNVAVRLGHAGYRDKAREAYAISISTCRFLKARDAGGDENDNQLARALVNLGVSYSWDSDRKADMQSAHDEAVEVYLALAQRNPDRYLGAALRNFHTMVVMNRRNWDERKERYARAARALESLDSAKKYDKEIGWIRRDLPVEAGGT